MDQLFEIMRFELDNLPGGIDDVARKFLDTVCNDDTDTDADYETQDYDYEGHMGKD